MQGDSFGRAGRVVRRFTVVLIVPMLLVAALVASPPPAAADGNEAPGNPAGSRALTTGEFHSCAILANGSVRCWGLGGQGQLGAGDTVSRGDDPDEMGAFLPAVSLGSGRTAIALTAGSVHTCAILDNGSVKCWGDNTSGQLGLGDTANRGDGPNEMGDNLPAVNLGTGRTATTVGAGAFHTCAILDTGALKCWGINTEGQLGLGDTANRGDAPGEMGDNLPLVSLGTGRTATALTAGLYHTCVRLDTAAVKCWGTGNVGQTGLGDTSARGDAPNEMGDNLPAVNLGTGRTATAVTAGPVRTCARLDNNAIKCWGHNFNGELGLGDTANRGDAPGEMGDDLPTVSLGNGPITITAVSAGGSHVCASFANGLRKCWGVNGSGQLGQEDSADRGRRAGEMGVGLPAIFLPPAGIISGTVTDSVSATPIPNVTIAVLRTSDFSMASSAQSDDNGAFTTDAPPGSYFLYLLDPGAGHPDGFTGPPTIVTVTDGGTSTVSATMAPTRGAFSGTVTDKATGIPLAGVAVYAIGNAGIMGGATTTASGTYTVAHLPVGTYRAVFIDGNGRRNVQYSTGSPDYAGATPFNVTAGATTPNVNAVMFRP